MPFQPEKCKPNVFDRFWSKVDVKGPDDCWNWTASTNDGGYGTFWFKRLMGAHEYSDIVANGPKPRGICTLHKCDNRRCVNPSHLFRGTHSDNTKDMYAKGRQGTARCKGENQPNAKLTTEDVKAIRQDLDDGVTQRSLAARYGVSQSTIAKIARRDRWTHV